MSAPGPMRRDTRQPASRRRLLAWTTVAGLSLAAAMTWAAAAEPMVLKSENGHFVVRVDGLGPVEPLNRMLAVELTIKAAGEPVPDATVAVTGRHRYALDPLPTAPAVTRGPAAGMYLLEGLRFHVPGEWRVTLEIQAADIKDRISLNLVVK
jgi:hypothetical protein